MSFLTFLIAVLPLALSAFLSWRWWQSLSHPWVFALLGAVGVYAVMATLVLGAFRGIGIAAAPPVSPSLFDRIETQLILLVLAFLVLGSFGLWALRAAFAKA